MLAISSKPRHGEIAPEKVDEYFEEIEADAAIVQAFHKSSQGKPMQRSYSKHVKPMMCVDQCSLHDKSSAKLVGQVLEFVAVENKPKNFVLLRNGLPLPNHAVTIALMDKKHHKLMTDAEGAFSIAPTFSGVILLLAVVITIPEKVTAVYHSDYATLTLDLGAT